MEQTMGKRIAENRKRLGLTQDALAEKLGVTAQAVSKWENDQSCPDIATIPLLADIFDISTDELLGRKNQTVHNAEVVEDSRNPNCSWEFHWDVGKKGAIAFAVLVLLAGALTLTSKLLSWEVSFWDILWPCSLFVFGLFRLISKFSVLHFGCLLLGGYYLIRNLGFWQLDLAGELVFPAAVLLFGLALLVDALRKPRKPKFHIFKNGAKLCDESGERKMESKFSTDEDTFSCSLAFGEKTQDVFLSTLRYGDINCSFGEMTVDLSGCEQVSDNCRIDATCAFGQLNLLVPKKFRVHTDCHTVFAGLSTKGQHDAEPSGVIDLCGSASFGEILVRYI